MRPRHVLLLAALCLLAIGCVRIRPAPSAVGTPPSGEPSPSATLGPTAELDVGLADLIPAVASPTPPPQRYTVQAGDTLWLIAQRFGVTPEEIIKTSRLADPNSLAVGDTLLIPQKATAATPQAGTPATTPAPAQQRHVVQPGESLATIAERFGVTAADIARANRLVDPNRLAVGDTLVIPARPTQQPPAATPAPRPQRRYIVKEGDSLWSIAQDHGVSVEALQAANPGLTERLQVGRTLVVP